ncbi:unnamed protein product [Macrosiphum euphorbiae]|uniref:Uncharacterized protein n=1 Tax=Macrosiphum euphorbiae TaxID=13131 RepID=A0AAV0XPD2_9HEMI|nr:unnamed protein product [Macrosiphum euphorbiae]
MSGNITITGKNCTVYNTVHRGRGAGKRGGSRIKATVNGRGGRRGRGSGRQRQIVNGRDPDDGGRSDTRPRSRSRSTRRPAAAVRLKNIQINDIHKSNQLKSHFFR